MIFKFVILSFLIFPCVYGAPNKCNALKVDKCASDIFVFGHSNLTIPQTDEELTIHCKSRFQALRCVQNYIKECLSSFSKQVASLLIKGAATNAKMQCKQNRGEFLDRGKCLHKNRDGLNRCMKRLVKQLSIAEKREEKISLICCLFKEYRDCSMSVLGQDKTCDNQDVKYFKTLAEGNAADMFEYVCRSRKINYSKNQSSCVPVDDEELLKTKRPLSLLPSYINIFSSE
ncbi:uncharacterized protein LOC141856531 [Brevipalpus obovatus]|uniref:uncharacterized protein LOC141856531 n=1 Tax=Brevipalpus obovatus TaxID=246614 RepID=UPI003D9E32E3